MDLGNFEYYVRNMVDDAHYKEHRHTLSAVHQSLRERYLHTLGMGYKMPEALYHTNLSSRLPEKNYHRYMKFVTAKVGPDLYAGA